MGLQLLTDRRSDQITGVLSCYDRMLIQGTLPGLCFAEGMTGYLYAHHIRVFDYAQWAQPLRETLRENAQRLAAENALEIEFIRRPKSFRKEDKIHQVLKNRGDHPGLVWIFSAMEPCSTYRPGTIRPRARPLCAPTTASACIITFTSSMKSWDCAMSASPLGVPSGCRFISTGITGWPAV